MITLVAFKICRGKENSIPAEIKDGYLYVCTDTGNVFIDYIDDAGSGRRRQINARYADKLRANVSSDGNGSDTEDTTDDIETIELDVIRIVEHLSDKNNPHELTLEQLGLQIAELSESLSYLNINEV